MSVMLVAMSPQACSCPSSMNMSYFAESNAVSYLQFGLLHYETGRRSTAQLRHVFSISVLKFEINAEAERNALFK